MEKNDLDFPRKIICLTEESVEILYCLGQEDRICGVSSFVKRPEEAKSKPAVSLFTSSNYKKINELSPDFIIGHSDIQKDIAKDLIEQGHNVYIANHRSINQIKDYVLFMGRLVGEDQKTQALITELENKIIEAKAFADQLKHKPLVYFEEWDDPMICSIKWVAELIEICGGINIFKDRENGLLAKQRFATSEEVIDRNPDIIFCCWCGKKARLDKVKARENWESINAITNNQVFELPPEIFLQPGVAPILDGINILIEHFREWNEKVR